MLASAVTRRDIVGALYRRLASFSLMAGSMSGLASLHMQSKPLDVLTTIIVRSRWLPIYNLFQDPPAAEDVRGALGYKEGLGTAPEARRRAVVDGVLLLRADKALAVAGVGREQTQDLDEDVRQ